MGPQIRKVRTCILWHTCPIWWVCSYINQYTKPNPWPWIAKSHPQFTIHITITAYPPKEEENLSFSIHWVKAYLTIPHDLKISPIHAVLTATHIRSNHRLHYPMWPHPTLWHSTCHTEVSESTPRTVSFFILFWDTSGIRPSFSRNTPQELSSKILDFF